MSTDQPHEGWCQGPQLLNFISSQLVLFIEQLWIGWSRAVVFSDHPYEVWRQGARLSEDTVPA